MSTGFQVLGALSLTAWAYVAVSAWGRGRTRRSYFAAAMLVGQAAVLFF